MAIQDDFSVSATGDIRYTGATSQGATYTWASNTVTITFTAHGWTVGMTPFLNFTSGGASADGYYTILTTTTNTFTVALAGSGVSGNVTVEGPGSNYTVIAFHRWLGDLMDDAQAAGNDILDITDSTASERATDNFVTLNSPYNIDDIAAQHLYDGSIVQDGGNTIYDGILVFAAPGTYLQIIQNGAPLAPNFWTTGLNADASAGISHRFLVKVRTAGADIDGRRLVGQTREVGFTSSEFKTTTARGNNVLALTYATDLNNATPAATIKGWTSISNTEGYRLIDVNNDGVSEPYYSEWNRAGQTINQLYERTKWLSRRSTPEDSNAETGDNFIIGNGTITGQAQSFQNGAVAQFLTRIHARLKKVGTPTGNLVAKLYSHSGATYGTDSVPGSLLATSKQFDVSKLTISYLEKEIEFSAFADSGLITIDVNSGAATFTRSSGNFLTDGFVPGATIRTSGFANAGNNTTKIISTVTATVITVTSGAGLVTESGSGNDERVLLISGGQYEMVASTNYVIALEYTGGDGSNYVHIEGDATGTHSGNRSQKNGSWTVPSADDDLWFQCFAVPKLYELAGERFRGITHEIIADNPVGTFNATELISWSGGIGQLLGKIFLDNGAGVIINVNASAGTFTRTTGNFLTDGFRVGQTIVTSNFTDSGNNTTKVISAVTATVITVTNNSGLVTESGTGDERVKAGYIWMQLLTGVIPTDNQVITGATTAATADVNVTVTERTLSYPFIGVSTGASLIGSYGLGVETADLSASDILFDLINTQRVPPNNVIFTVSGLISGEDRVLVGPESGGGLQLNQRLLNTTLSAAAETAVVTTVSIPSDTPSAGTIRVETNAGIYRRVSYSSFAGSTFTIKLSDTGTTALSVSSLAFNRAAGSFLADGFSPGDRITMSGFTNAGNNTTKTIATVTATIITVTDTTGLVNEGAGSDERILATGADFSSDNATSGNDIFISYIDKLADATTATFTVVYSSNRSLFVRVRDGGGTPIKTFETTATLGSAGGSATAIRTSDA